MTRFEQGLLWGATAATALTGTVYGIMKYLMTSDDPYAVIHHPWQPFFLKAHVLTAPLLVFAVGAVFSKHVLRQWRSGADRGKRTGGSIVLVAAPMVLTGYLIQTVTLAPSLRAIALAHIGFGVVYVVAMLAHRRSARTRPRRSEPLEVVTNPLD